MNSLTHKEQLENLSVFFDSLSKIIGCGVPDKERSVSASKNKYKVTDAVQELKKKIINKIGNEGPSINAVAKTKKVKAARVKARPDGFNAVFRDENGNDVTSQVTAARKAASAARFEKLPLLYGMNVGWSVVLSDRQKIRIIKMVSSAKALDPSSQSDYEIEYMGPQKFKVTRVR